MNEQSIIAGTKHWLEHTIINYNFCPFARKEFVSEKIHYEVVDESNREELLHALVNEFKRLDENSEIETTLVIYPVGLESFFDYLDFVELANHLLFESDYEGIYQLATFHPDYCFDGVLSDDVSNYTNRSPLPIIHIIREESLEKVLEIYPNPESIPDNNIKRAEKNGRDEFENILSRAKDLINTSS